MSRVVSCNEPFDWQIAQGNHCQILFMTADMNLRSRTDIVLSFDHLVKMFNDWSDDQRAATVVRHTVSNSSPGTSLTRPMDRVVCLGSAGTRLRPRVRNERARNGVASIVNR
jgi:hypothetical protein